MKDNFSVSDSIREEYDGRFKVLLKNAFVSAFIWIKNKIPFTRGMVVLTGQVRDELYDPKTGITTKTIYPIHFAHYNTVNNNLKYAIAKWIGGSNAGEFIGANTLATQASPSGKDGICETTGGYVYTTTKDSGGTGSVNNIVFKGVRTAAGSESHADLEIGLNLDIPVSTYDLTTVYAAQTISKSLTSGQVYTVYWTITVS